MDDQESLLRKKMELQEKVQRELSPKKAADYPAPIPEELQSWRAGVVAALDRFRVNSTMPDIPLPEPAEDYASDFALRVITKLRAFEASLNADQETGLHLANYHQALTLHVREVSWIDPALIVFGGVLDGSGHRAEMLQHVSQINLILVALPRENPQAPRSQIGFHAFPATGEVPRRAEEQT